MFFNLKVNTYIMFWSHLYYNLKEGLPHLKINVSGTCYHLILEMPV